MAFWYRVMRKQNYLNKLKSNINVSYKTNSCVFTKVKPNSNMDNTTKLKPQTTNSTWQKKDRYKAKCGTEY